MLSAITAAFFLDWELETVDVTHRIPRYFYCRLSKSRNQPAIIIRVISDWLPTLLVLRWRLSCRLVLIYCYFFHNIIIVNDIIVIIVLLVSMKYFTSHFISFILFSFVKILIMKFFYIWHGTIFITFERFSFVKFLRM